jgi:peptidoglycan-associated lipoprotein
MTPRRSPTVVLIVSLLVLTGCGQKTATTETPTASAPTPAAGPPASPDQPRPTKSPSTPTPEPTAPQPHSASATPPAAGPPPSVADFTDEPALKDVFFDPGRADIGRNGAKILQGNARWLLENRGYVVLVEGHTDYKGTQEANLAMGERRAKAVASFLIKEGVPDTRVWTVSNGSDRPVCSEKTDACAAKNRRVHFRVKRQ